MNGQWIRRLSLDELYNRVEKYWPEAARNADPAYKKQVLALVQDRLKTLAELPVASSYFFSKLLPSTNLITDNKQLKTHRAEYKAS